MQRLVSLRKLASSTTFSKSFISHANQNQLLSSFCRHPFHSTHSLPFKTHTIRVNRNLFSSSTTQLSNTFLHSPIWFKTGHHYTKRSFQSLSGSSSYSGARRSWFQRLSSDEVVYGLIIANAAVFLLWRAADQKFMTKNFTISVDNFVHGRLHTLITSAFSHVDVEHIVSNMIGLYFFGMNIGRRLGPEYLLKLYLAGAIGGSVFYLVHHAFLASTAKNQGIWMSDPSRTPGLGASGAVNAILLLDILLHPTATLYFDFFIPVPAALLGIFLVGKDIWRIIEGDRNISGSAHLGGAAVAGIAWASIRRRIGGRRF